MKSFELAIAHLRSLPAPAQVQAVDFIERLREWCPHLKATKRHRAG